MKKKPSLRGLFYTSRGLTGITLPQQIANLKLEKGKLHKGMHRKVSAIQKIIQRAAEANDKV